MSTTPVARGVDDDTCEERPLLGPISGKPPLYGQPHEYAEGVVDAVERILGAEPLAARQTGKSRPFLAHDLRERIEHVASRVSGHPWGRCQARSILQV